MRVLLLNWYADRSGGADAYAEMLAIELARRGHEVHFVGYGASETAAAAATVHTLTRNAFHWRLLAPLQWRDTERQVARLDLPTPDAIVGSPLFAYRAAARRFPGVPGVYLPHARITPVEVAGTLPGRPGGLPHLLGVATYRRLERWALRHSRCTVRFTPGNVKLMADYYGAGPRVAFEVIPPPVEVPPTAAPVPRGTGTGSGPLRLLSLGRLVPSKNVGFLLGVLAALPAGLHWTLDVVGDGPERVALEEFARGRLAGRVAFHGHRDDPATFYRAADLLVNPSRLESACLVTVEAMAHGLPNLVIRDDGRDYLNSHHELIADGLDGLIAGGEVDFAARLGRAIRDPASLTVLGAAARARAIALHDRVAVFDHWDRLLRRVAGPAPASGLA